MVEKLALDLLADDKDDAVKPGVKSVADAVVHDRFAPGPHRD
jgi:hypothetical protein